MVRVGIVGLGKMGLSHHAIFNAHPEVELAGICDSSRYVLSVLGKYTGAATFGDYDEMLAELPLDAVVIATPSSAHTAMVEKALAAGLHVFCEKPLTLDADQSAGLAAQAQERGLVTQAGYHNRFVASFREAKSLLESGALGELHQVTGEAYGPVVLKSQGRTWRTQRTEGGGCLYDYAAHVINLINWYCGMPAAVAGTALPSLFSRDTDDAALSTLYFDDGLRGQLTVNWSDESYRKMSTQITLRGSNGRIYADRQELQVYLRDDAAAPPGYRQGWNVRYTTELTPPVWFYLRGEEYSEQVDAFVKRAEAGRVEGVNDFAGAAETDRTIAMMVADAARGPVAAEAAAPAPARRGFFARRRAA